MTYYYPKRPVKSFQDLEVYQKSYNLAIEIVRRVTADIARSSAETKDKSQTTAAEIATEITKNLMGVVLEIPKLIASAHSVRFGQSEQAVELLEKAMLYCNLAVVNLEKYRDLVNQKIETEFFEEQIKEYLRTRGKIMRLQRSWLKFFEKK
ncbi:hypothetical protein FJZ40_00595 [Candidatus Shapirobacteria bacterium]|nr:hypothetical protein [Candidatus Shapirobacteria bacterium]